MPYQKSGTEGALYRLAEFTYPILPTKSIKRGANWFYSLPENDRICLPADVIYRDYVDAKGNGNIFSLDVGPGRDGRLRPIDVETLAQVGNVADATAKAKLPDGIDTIVASDGTRGSFAGSPSQDLQSLEPHLGVLRDLLVGNVAVHRRHQEHGFHRGLEFRRQVVLVGEAEKIGNGDAGAAGGFRRHGYEVLPKNSRMVRITRSICWSVIAGEQGSQQACFVASVAPG